MDRTCPYNAVHSTSAHRMENVQKVYELKCHTHYKVSIYASMG
jgi:hypothetical protein